MSDLLQRDHALRKKRVTAHPYPGYKDSVRRDEIRPWHLLPNIRKFVIKLAPYDWLLLLFGVYKKWSPTQEFHVWKNGPANRYIDYMFKRLHKEVSLKEYTRGSKTMWILMRSTAYQVACYNYVARNWHRKKTIFEVMRDLKRINKLCTTQATSLAYKRVYIPKIEGEPDGPQRPLGVPSLEWRVYLHMYNNCITQWRLVTEGNSQHGYLPGRGVITAWIELIKAISTSPNIYEADFKGFFDSIELTKLSTVLRDLGLPEKEVIFLEDLNKSQPTLQDEDKVDEFKVRQYNYISECLSKELNPTGQYWEPIRKEIEEAFGSSNPLESPLLLECLLEGCGEYWELSDLQRNPNLVLLKYVEIQWALSSSFGETSKFYGMLKGVPQGAPTSCSLATLALRPLEAKSRVIEYADDVIYFPESSKENPIETLANEEMGIEVQETKSRWARKDWKWLVESIKFLGFRYYPAVTKHLTKEEIIITLLVLSIMDGIIWGIPIFFCLGIYVIYKGYWYTQPARFVADTRKGAKLEFTDKESFMTYLYNARDLALSDKYLSDAISKKTLEEWLSDREEWWSRLKGRAKILFTQSIKLKKSSHWIDNPLTGFIFSRMQSNSWNISRKQDFTLSYKENSWMDREWVKYCWKHIIPRKRISVFTASSFATNDLLAKLSDLKLRQRGVKKIIRVTYASTKTTLSAKQYIGYNTDRYWDKWSNPRGHTWTFWEKDIV